MRINMVPPSGNPHMNPVIMWCAWWACAVRSAAAWGCAPPWLKGK